MFIPELTTLHNDNPVTLCIIGIFKMHKLRFGEEKKLYCALFNNYVTLKLVKIN